jgi:hypothetical protein
MRLKGLILAEQALSSKYDEPVLFGFSTTEIWLSAIARLAGSTICEMMLAFC